MGAEQGRKREVLTGFGQPHIPPLPAPRRLPVGDHQGAFGGGRLGDQIGGFVISGLTAWQIITILSNKKGFGMDFVQRFVMFIEKVI